MAGLHNPRMHKQDVDSHRSVVQEAGGTSARLSGQARAGSVNFRTSRTMPRRLCKDVLYRRKSTLRTTGGVCGRQVKEEIFGEDRGTANKKIPNGGVTDRFSALFTRPIGVRVYRSTDSIDSNSARDGISGRAVGVLAHRRASSGSVGTKQERSM